MQAERLLNLRGEGKKVRQCPSERLVVSLEQLSCQNCGVYGRRTGTVVDIGLLRLFTA